MISLDQILLLEKKVESAVAKIAQLRAENDALRSKCSELTNALSSKSERLSSFEKDQNRIESGIMHALDRLSLIENTVLKAAGSVPSASMQKNSGTADATGQACSRPQESVQVADSTGQEAQISFTSLEPLGENRQAEKQASNVNPNAQNSDSGQMDFGDTQEDFSEQDFSDEGAEDSDGGTQFDIF